MGFADRVQKVLNQQDPTAKQFTLQLGAAGESEIRFSRADASNPTSVWALDNTSQQIHVTDAGAVGTDWARSAGTHPELAIHSNTTPITDYLAIGNHDGTTASIDVVGGTTLDLDIAGTTAAAVTATGISIPTGTITIADGGTVTQGTDKSTGVTLSTHSGQITTNNASLAGGVEVAFTVTNTAVAATDCILLSQVSGNSTGVYLLMVSVVASGSFQVTISNVGATASEVIVFNFIVFSAATS